VRVRVWGNPGGAWILTALADSDLQSGPDLISIGNVFWTASNSPPFQDGFLSTVLPIVAGAGTDPTNERSNLDFYFNNSWDYVTGDYSATATLTLAAP
jgi:hypothetical protein